MLIRYRDQLKNEGSHTGDDSDAADDDSDDDLCGIVAGVTV